MGLFCFGILLRYFQICLFSNPELMEMAFKMIDIANFLFKNKTQRRINQKRFPCLTLVIMILTAVLFLAARAAESPKRTPSRGFRRRRRRLKNSLLILVFKLLLRFIRLSLSGCQSWLTIELITFSPLLLSSSKFSFDVSPRHEESNISNTKFFLTNIVAILGVKQIVSIKFILARTAFLKPILLLI